MKPSLPVLPSPKAPGSLGSALGYFGYLPSAVVNRGVQMSGQVPPLESFGSIPGSRIAGSYGFLKFLF